MSSTKIRPLGVTILAVLQIIAGIIGVVMGSLFATISGMIGIDYLAAISGIVSGILVAIGIVSFVMAWGLLQGKPWAWTITLILAIIALIVDLASVNIIGLVIEGIILFYLFRPHVKEYFGKGKIVL